ncbi:DUF4825 domain-containing protein [Xylanibacillus composti]|uniref:DUF4825 domain-containing protein n=1 Tax=Xylanibacillus composti TaxID=1572762 RepID=A0A8J4M1V3_9BACL|nr:DUF4825 domain-containing protein [Xylanibacillus composti]MDT9725821.1 DUF4825 domain-containing protein [Xylanibacillus composti]GIQ69225.1 hypothetical protein XYCOK13_20490 [Xylanibacillus composti]
MLIGLSLILILTACGQSETNGMLDIEDVQVEDLQDGAHPYVGDANKNRELIMRLPGNRNFQGMEISGHHLIVQYGLQEDSAISEEQFRMFWLHEDRLEQLLVHNAAALLLFTGNAEQVTLQLNEDVRKHFLVLQREGLTSWLGVEPAVFLEDPAMWEEAVLDGLVGNKAAREQFLQQYPIVTE